MTTTIWLSELCGINYAIQKEKALHFKRITKYPLKARKLNNVGGYQSTQTPSIRPSDHLINTHVQKSNLPTRPGKHG